MDWAKLLESWGPAISLLAVVAYFLRKDFLIPWRDRWLVKTLAFFDEIGGLAETFKTIGETVKGISEAIKNVDVRLSRIEKDLELWKQQLKSLPKPDETDEKKSSGIITLP